MKKILFLETDPFTIDGYNERFSREGWLSLLATSYSEAFHLAIEDDPDAVLFNLNLEGEAEKGWAALGGITSHKKWQHVPVIIVADSEGSREKANELGFADYVVRPEATPEEMVKRIKAVMKA